MIKRHNTSFRGAPAEQLHQASITFDKGIDVTAAPTNRGTVYDMTNLDIAEDGSATLRKPLLWSKSIVYDYENIHVFKGFLKDSYLIIQGVSVFFNYNNSNANFIKLYLNESDYKKGEKYSENLELEFDDFDNVAVLNTSSSSILTGGKMLIDSKLQAALPYTANIGDYADVNIRIEYRESKFVGFIQLQEPAILENTIASDNYTVNFNTAFNYAYAIRDNYNGSTTSVNAIVPYIGNFSGAETIENLTESVQFRIPTSVKLNDINESDTKKYILKAFMNFNSTDLDSSKLYYLWEKTYDGITWEPVEDVSKIQGAKLFHIKDYTYLREDLVSSKEEEYSTFKDVWYAPFNTKDLNQTNSITQRPDVLVLDTLEACTYRFSLRTPDIQGSIKFNSISLEMSSDTYMGEQYIVLPINTELPEHKNIKLKLDYEGVLSESPTVKGFISTEFPKSWDTTKYPTARNLYSTVDIYNSHTLTANPIPGTGNKELNVTLDAMTIDKLLQYQRMYLNVEVTLNNSVTMSETFKFIAVADPTSLGTSKHVVNADNIVWNMPMVVNTTDFSLNISAYDAASPNRDLYISSPNAVSGTWNTGITAIKYNTLSMYLNVNSNDLLTLLTSYMNSKYKNSNINEDMENSHMFKLVCISTKPLNSMNDFIGATWRGTNNGKSIVYNLEISNAHYQFTTSNQDCHNLTIGYYTMSSEDYTNFVNKVKSTENVIYTSADSKIYTYTFSIQGSIKWGLSTGGYYMEMDEPIYIRNEFNILDHTVISGFKPLFKSIIQDSLKGNVTYPYVIPDNKLERYVNSKNIANNTNYGYDTMIVFRNLDPSSNWTDCYHNYWTVYNEFNALNLDYLTLLKDFQRSNNSINMPHSYNLFTEVPNTPYVNPEVSPENIATFLLGQSQHTPVVRNMTELLDEDLPNTMKGYKTYYNYRILTYGKDFKNVIYPSDFNSYFVGYQNAITLKTTEDDYCTAIVPYRDYLIAACNNSMHLIRYDGTNFSAKTVNSFVGVPDMDRKTLKATLNGVIFKSGTKVYILQPSLYSSDDTILNVMDISKPIAPYLESGTDNFAISTEQEYMLCIPRASDTLMLKYDYAHHLWTKHIYPVVFKESTINTLDDIRVVAIRNNNFNEYKINKSLKDINYGDELTAPGNLIARKPIDFLIDSGQKGDTLHLTKQYVETKLIAAVNDNNDTIPCNVDVLVDNINLVKHTDSATSASFWKNLNVNGNILADEEISNVLSASVPLLDANTELLNVNRQMFLRYSGKGFTVRHKIYGKSSSNFKFYVLYYRCKSTINKQ